MIITMTRVEGPTSECNQVKTATTFAAADHYLRHWSHTAPKNGGYDKVDFRIKDDENGLIYGGRYDLKHWHAETANLKAHVTGFLEHTVKDGSAPTVIRERAQELIELFKEQP